MEEDIKNIEEMKNNCLNKRDYIDENAERKSQAIENLINKNKDLKLNLENKYKESHLIQSRLDEANAKIIELNKMIDEMASFIEVAELDEDIAKAYCKNETCTDINSFNCKKCIIDYFKKKASEENEITYM